MDSLKTLSSKQTIESREVAEMVGKNHKELLRDIRTMIDYLGESIIAPSDFFITSYYVDAQNKNRPCFLLTKQGCEMVGNKLTGKKGTLFTAKYVVKFNEMESEQSKPSYMVDDPIKRAEAWIEEKKVTLQLEEKVAVQEQILAEHETKLTYLDEILNSRNTMSITQIAADYGMSAIELNRILALHGIQRKVGGQWILLKQHMNKGYTKSKTFINDKGSYPLTKWTQKGRLKIHELLESLGYAALVDEQLEMDVL